MKPMKSHRTHPIPRVSTSRPSSSFTIPSPSTSTSPPAPYAAILTAILTHQRERKAADDEEARQLKNTMIAEYQDQSEQHERLTTEFVGSLQGGLDGLVATLINQALNANTSDGHGDLKANLHESINNYFLSHLSTYQKAVKKHRSNSRQRTDRFGGKTFTRYKQTLEKDESDLLGLFSKLDEEYREMSPSPFNASLSALPNPISDDRFNLIKIKREREPEPHLNYISSTNEQHDSDVEMDGMCGTSSASIPYSKVSRLSGSGREKMRKI
ncbi:hypothetical protein IFR05_010248 [Cadophora sp. M221]|nr:hypothetical protein IFR05_010248 [Cadophora sp. M221]